MKLLALIAANEPLAAVLAWERQAYALRDRRDMILLEQAVRAK